MVALIRYESLLICNEKVNINMHVQDKMNILGPSTYQKLRISITVNCITSGEFFCHCLHFEKKIGTKLLSENLIWGIFEIILITKLMKR